MARPGPSPARSGQPGRAWTWHALAVLTYEEAERAAQRFLNGSAGGPYVITGDWECAVGWVFFCDSRQREDPGGRAGAPAGKAPVLVDRDTGQASFTGTARPVEEYAAERAERKRRLSEGWPGTLDARFLTLLALVRDGAGRRSARQLDLLVSTRHAPRDGATVLDELVELERRGLVRREPGGTGYRWAVTDAGSDALRAAP